MFPSNRIRNYKVIGICEDTGLEALVCDNCEKTMGQMIATSLNGTVSKDWAFFYKAVPQEHVLITQPLN